MTTIQQGSVGTVFRRQIKVGGEKLDISGAATLEMHFRPPKGGAVVVKTAVFPTDGVNGYKGPGDGSDGFLEYVSEAGFLDTTGDWRWQPKVVKGGNTYLGPVRDFTVAFNV